MYYKILIITDESKHTYKEIQKADFVIDFRNNKTKLIKNRYNGVIGEIK